MNTNDWIEEAYRQYHDFLYKIGSRYLKGRSAQISGLEDSIQSVFMLMLKKRNKLASHPNIIGWMIVALRRELGTQIKEERKRDYHCAFSLDDDKNEFQSQNILHDDLSNPELLFSNASQERLEAIEKWIGKENTDLLKQHYINSVPLSDLAKQKQSSESAIKMRIFRLKEKIRSHPEIFLFFSFFALLLPR